MEVLALKMKNNIKELRKARGLRQEDMAKLLGVSRQTIVAMENDKYDPTLELAIKTARLLEQPVEEIFFLDEESLKWRIENGEWRMTYRFWRRLPLNKASANDSENAIITLIFHFQFSFSITARIA